MRIGTALLSISRQVSPSLLRGVSAGHRQRSVVDLEENTELNNIIYLKSSQ
jgi:hypothetical protein